MNIFHWVLAAALLASSAPFRVEANSYGSGGGRSYSSSSSHSSSSGRSHSSSSSSRSSSGSTRSSGSGGLGAGARRSSSPSADRAHNTSSSASGRTSDNRSNGGFTSAKGKSYSSGSTSSSGSQRTYTAGKSYSSNTGKTFASGSPSEQKQAATDNPTRRTTDAPSSGFTFDTDAARARKEEGSKQTFARFKESQVPAPSTPVRVPASDGGAASYQAKPFLISDTRTRSYIPDDMTVASRPARIENVFTTYSSRPIVIYRDSYSSLFWWWLLDRSLEERAGWAYHHRYDMDPSRYEALLAQDRQLEARVSQLETERLPRDPTFVPSGLDRDLMYSDAYVAHAYSNRPTTAGVVAFWVLAVPTALGLCAFFIWLIWFKRWQTKT